MPSLTIIIPSVREDNLDAVASVNKQTVATNLIIEKDPNETGAGPTRNRAIKKCGTDWVGFLDDDDTLNPKYHEWLDYESQDCDVVIFQMKLDQMTLPGHTNPKLLKFNWVGISYALKTKIAKAHPFKNIIGEDFDLLTRLADAGYKIKISPYIAYYVRDSV
jgi:glycosyltransferase involved in cell wall biosynthesis